MSCVVGDVGLRLGDWRDVLAGVECDSLIADAPYSPRTHKGERGTRLAGVKESTYNPGNGAGERTRNGIDYAALTEDAVREFVTRWRTRVRHWSVIFGDDVTWRWWRDAWSDAGWVTFAPVVWVKSNPPPRFAGDGPTSSCEYICVARPRRRVRDSGSRPGHYEVLTQMDRSQSGFGGFVGAKDPDGMRALVRDYSRPGDMIVDAYAGTGTTLIAALREGRPCVGAEIDVDTYRRASERLRGLGPSVTKHGQRNLWVSA